MEKISSGLVVCGQSHHKPREGAFELNDVFAIINAVPAIGLLYYGFFNKGLVPGLCFGAVSLFLSFSFSTISKTQKENDKKLLEKHREAIVN